MVIARGQWRRTRLDDRRVGGLRPPSCTQPRKSAAVLPAGAGSEIRILTEHKDFLSILLWLRDLFQLNQTPSIAIQTVPLVEKGNVCRQLCDGGERRNAIGSRILSADPTRDSSPQQKVVSSRPTSPDRRCPKCSHTIRIDSTGSRNRSIPSPKNETLMQSSVATW